MNEHIKELYRSCRSKEALASQDQYNSADVLIGSEVEKFAELIVKECMNIVENFPLNPEDIPYNQKIIPYMIFLQEKMQLHFGVEE